MKKLLFISTLFATILLGSACKKESNCFDQELKDKNKNNFCTQDCPGVIGCDGKTYCNECEAARQGIRLK